jgi:hypothetical protein
MSGWMDEFAIQSGFHFEDDRKSSMTWDYLLSQHHHIRYMKASKTRWCVLFFQQEMMPNADVDVMCRMPRRKNGA